MTTGIAEIPLCVRVVEDSSSLADMLGMMMDIGHIRFCTTTNNFHMLLAPDLWEGITTALCDLDLGEETTGEMVLRYLKETHPWIKRVVLSATGDAHLGRIKSLAHVVLLKPADIETITEAIR